MQLSFGAHRGWQTEGIMMGQAAGGAIFRMVLAAHEVKALRSHYLAGFQIDLPRLFILWHPLC